MNQTVEIPQGSKPAGRASARELGLRNLQRCSQALSELAGVWPDAAGSPTVNWDDHYRVFFTRRHESSYRALFGSYWNARTILKKPTLRSRIKCIANMLSPGRLSGPFQAGVPLPPDTVLLPPIADKTGMVVASRHAGLVLKVVYERGEVTKEVENWTFVKEAGIADHVPALLDHGSTSDGGQWMLTSFAPNTQPLNAPLNPWLDQDRQWRHWLRWNVLPVMQRYYEARGAEDKDLDELVAGIRERYEEDQLPESLFRILRLAEDACQKSTTRKVTIATLHNDLNPGHIHRHGKQWWIIDWGSSVRGPVSKDVVNQYVCRWIWNDAQRAFWRWLSGEVGLEQLPSGLREEIEMYLNWHAAWRKRPTDSDGLRCELLITILNVARGVVRNHGRPEELPDLRSRADVPGWVRSFGTNLEALGAFRNS